MEHTEKHLLRFYIALFGAVLSHSILFLFLFLYAPSIELERKTIPFQLISNDNAGQTSNKASMSQSENALAAQEFLRTLNESRFEKLIRKNTQSASQTNNTNSIFKPNSADENPFKHQPTFKQNNNSSSALQGFQNIFSKQKNKEKLQNELRQISTNSLEELTEYEILLLQKLAQNELYDDFHPVMAGSIFIENLFAQHLVHKTILSIIALAIFSTLLIGRHFYGWRGLTASKWTLWGFSILMISFFGSKLALEQTLTN